MTAGFTEGRTVAADLILGCDGVHFTTRRLTLPEAPTPQCLPCASPQAFARLEQLREPRAEKIGALGRRIGDRKVPSMAWLDDRSRAAVPARGRPVAREHCIHRIDWHETVGRSALGEPPPQQ